MNRATKHGLAAVALTLGLAGCARGLADQPLEEIVVSDRVDAQLRADQELDDAQIDVRTNDGVVQLVGVVRTQQDALRAVRIAENTAGVVDVINSLEVGDHEYNPPVLDEDALENEDSSESMQDPSWGQ